MRTTVRHSASRPQISRPTTRAERRRRRPGHPIDATGIRPRFRQRASTAASGAGFDVAGRPASRRKGASGAPGSPSGAPAWAPELELQRTPRVEASREQAERRRPTRTSPSAPTSSGQPRSTVRPPADRRLDVKRAPLDVHIRLAVRPVPTCGRAGLRRKDSLEGGPPTEDPSVDEHETSGTGLSVTVGPGAKRRYRSRLGWGGVDNPVWPSSHCLNYAVTRSPQAGASPAGAPSRP
jgi:hypothetical protein